MELKEHYIKIPIAADKITGKLKNAKDVLNGRACNCSCKICNEDLIAVNLEIKQRAHFRHIKNPNCGYESYIHWLTKEVFKEIKEIYLPQIDSKALTSNQVSFHYYKEFIESLLKENSDVPELRDAINQNILFQEKCKIEILSIDNEVIDESNRGDIKVDIVIEVKGGKLFIEPFYSNKIDDEKFKKIQNIDISTISINLLSFVNENNHLFTIEELKEFLIHDMESKNWEFIRIQKKEKLLNNLRNNIEKLIMEFDNHKATNKIIDERLKEIEKKESTLKMEIGKLLNEITKLKKELIHKRIKFPSGKISGLLEGE